MAAKGRETILGMTRDPQFGPLLMFGLGGTYVEIFKDVIFRVAPISEHWADKMIRELKGFQIFTGYRGEPPADLAAIARMPGAPVATGAGFPGDQGTGYQPAAWSSRRARGPRSWTPGSLSSEQ